MTSYGSWVACSVAFAATVIHSDSYTIPRIGRISDAEFLCEMSVVIRHQLNQDIGTDAAGTGSLTYTSNSLSKKWKATGGVLWLYTIVVVQALLKSFLKTGM